MLSRYTSEAMARIWSDAARYERWRRVELAVLAARLDAGDVPPAVYAAVSAVPVPTPAEVEAVEAVVRHDVVAFLDAWTKSMGRDSAGAVHRHLTSSDIVDTAQACALAEATDLIVAAGRRLVVALADRALEHRTTLCVARTHGQPATLDVLGHRLADFTFAVHRAVDRLSTTRSEVAVANISGPVGTGIDLPPELVRNVAESLGLGVPASTTQVLFRDSIATWVCDLAVLAAVCESVATDIRIAQHDGVSELAEPYRQGQEGSSAMPHKRNPVRAENIVGIARVLRGHVGPAIEDVALWGHRDITHSSVERIVLPDSAALCEYVLTSTADLVKGMVVDLDALAANIERAGGVLVSGRAQARLQGEGASRTDAALAVRERDRLNRATDEEFEVARKEVLKSKALAEMFDRLVQTRAQCVG